MNPSAWQIQNAVALAQATTESLRSEHGQIIETSDELLTAFLEEGVDIPTLIRRMVRAALDAKSYSAAAAERMKDLRARKERFDRQEDAWRATVLAVMQAVELTKLSDAEFSLSISPGKPKLIITDPDELPAHLVEAVTTLVPLSADIKAALVAGEVIPGATLAAPQPFLTVKVR